MNNLLIFKLKRIKFKNKNEGENDRFRYANKILVSLYPDLNLSYEEAKNSFINCYNVGLKDKVTLNDIEYFEGDFIKLSDYKHSV
mgnify:CR=1 FL=1